MFRDRTDAGKQLANRLSGYRDARAVVLALPRGGVVLGREVANELKLPLDIISVRKVGHPYSPEYALGAVDENGGELLNDTEASAVDPRWLKDSIEREQKEALRRAKLYRDGKNPTSLVEKTAIIVDDGIATGFTARLAVVNAKARGASHITLAVPVAPSEALSELQSLGAEIVTLEPPERFRGAVGAHYEAFPQVLDGEVCDLLRGTGR